MMTLEIFKINSLRKQPNQLTLIKGEEKPDTFPAKFMGAPSREGEL